MSRRGPQGAACAGGAGAADAAVGANPAPIEMLAMYAVEPDSPASEQPLYWLLLTTEGEADADGASIALRRYELRWTIEEYFRTLKTGDGIEARQLDNADDLRKCLAFDAITACEVFNLVRLARDRPQIPADEVVSEDDLLMLNARLDDYGIRRSQQPPGEAPDNRRFIVDVARLAGFHPRRSQPLPVIMKLWQGYVLLRESVFT